MIPPNLLQNSLFSPLTSGLVQTISDSASATTKTDLTQKIKDKYDGSVEETFLSFVNEVDDVTILEKLRKIFENNENLDVNKFLEELHTLSKENPEIKTQIHGLDNFKNIVAENITSKLIEFSEREDITFDASQKEILSEMLRNMDVNKLIEFGNKLNTLLNNQEHEYSKKLKESLKEFNSSPSTKKEALFKTFEEIYSKVEESERDINQDKTDKTKNDKDLPYKEVGHTAGFNLNNALGALSNNTSQKWQAVGLPANLSDIRMINPFSLVPSLGDQTGLTLLTLNLAMGEIYNKQQLIMSARGFLDTDDSGPRGDIPYVPGQLPYGQLEAGVASKNTELQSLKSKLQNKELSATEKQAIEAQIKEVEKQIEELKKQKNDQYAVWTALRAKVKSEIQVITQQIDKALQGLKTQQSAAESFKQFQDSVVKKAVSNNGGGGGK